MNRNEILVARATELKTQNKSWKQIERTCQAEGLRTLTGGKARAAYLASLMSRSKAESQPTKVITVPMAKTTTTPSRVDFKHFTTVTLLLDITAAQKVKILETAITQVN